MTNNLQLIRHDAFCFGGGVNRTGAEIYRVLMYHPCTAKEICEVTGIPRNTVFRKLRKMMKIVDWRTGEIHWLVIKIGNLYYANCDADFDEIASCLGTAGKSQRQRKKLREEIRLHKKYYNKVRDKNFEEKK